MKRFDGLNGLTYTKHKHHLNSKKKGYPFNEENNLFKGKINKTLIKSPEESIKLPFLKSINNLNYKNKVESLLNKISENMKKLSDKNTSGKEIIIIIKQILEAKNDGNLSTIKKIEKLNSILKLIKDYLKF